MDAYSLDLLNTLAELTDDRWVLVDNELRLDAPLDDGGAEGMMLAQVTVNDGTISVVEFDGWTIAGQYVISGSASVAGPRALALLESITAERV